jgi:succinate dehydrogenase/fumarate reductase flavoprotein subunit
METEVNVKTLDRRSFLGAAALGAGALGLNALTGCDSSDGAAPLAAAGIPEVWDRECDVVVIGSGTVLAGAVKCAAQGLETIIVESATFAGGTTITSGGKCYTPNPPASLAPGDSRDAALQYLKKCNPHSFVEDEVIEAWVDNAGEMIEFLIDATGASWQAFDNREDFYPEWPGATVGIRAFGVPKEDDPTATEGKGFQQPGIDAFESLGGTLLLSTPAKRLISRQLEDGRHEVLGVIAEESGQEITIKARKGVIIGTGAYDWNRDLCKQLLPYTSTYTWAIDTCTGGGLLMALGVGAELGQTNQGWGIMPEIYPIDEIEKGVELPIYAQGTAFSEDILHGAASYWTAGGSGPIVSRMGQRFYQEPGNYTTMAAWGGFDARAGEVDFEYRYMPYSFGILDAAAAAKAGYDAIDPQPGWLTKANSFEELAEVSGIDTYNFVNTMTRWQRDAAADGVDTEYGRVGIAPLGDPPYYAAKCCQFLQSTHGGIKIDGKARVVAALGDVIPRLYATSNAACTSGIVYPGNGGSIGPGMAFGYIAAKDITTLEDWA